MEVHQPLSEHIDDGEETLPIVLNASMQAFSQNANTDAAVMNKVMDVRSGIQ
ncbi:hypothetical protein ACLK1Y_06120 [Escherichia coli]